MSKENVDSFDEGKWYSQTNFKDRRLQVIGKNSQSVDFMLFELYEYPYRVSLIIGSRPYVHALGQLKKISCERCRNADAKFNVGEQLKPEIVCEACKKTSEEST